VNAALLRRFAAAMMGILLAFSLSAAPARAAVAPGTVVIAVTATLPPELAPLATGKRITYVSTAINGSPITATGLVLTPKTGKKNKVVAWGHGTTGLADRCAPSTSPAVFWPEARTAVAALLARGFTVAAPDYPGLGTPLPHPYLVGASEGRSIIDSVKAARQLDSALAVQYAVDGHSQGGQGALFAGQLAPAYDGALVLRGVSAIAPVSNAAAFAPLVPGTPGNGYLVMALYGLQAVEPAFNPNSVLAVPARQRATVLQSGCLYEILNEYAPLTAEQLLIGGTLPPAVVTKLARYVDPAQSPTTAPVLLVQGTDDMAVPAFLTTDLLFPQLDAYAQPVDLIEVPGADHDSAVVVTADKVATWIAGRLA
jgi:pimeloyl-ACP methyl ester carboxylesterase